MMTFLRSGSRSLSWLIPALTLLPACTSSVESEPPPTQTLQSLARDPNTGEVLDPRDADPPPSCTSHCAYDGVCCSRGCGGSGDPDCMSQDELQAVCDVPLLGPLFAAGVFTSVASTLKARWPNAGAVWDDLDPYGSGADFYWAHLKKSVDGYGPTMALVAERPLCGGDGCFDFLTDEVTADGDPMHPTLLFFDRTGDQGSWRSWPLIGIGWYFPFAPCHRPKLTCQTNPDLFFIHEAGYHHVLLGGDGGMTIATDSDLCAKGWPDGGILQSGCGDSDFDVTSVDSAGCQDIDDEDVETHFNEIRHGRMWDLHLWFSPSAGVSPQFGIEDPWSRWTDAPSGRVAISGRAFYYQNAAKCSCD